MERSGGEFWVPQGAPGEPREPPGCSREAFGGALGGPWGAVSVLFGVKVAPGSGNGDMLGNDYPYSRFAMFLEPLGRRRATKSKKDREKTTGKREHRTEKTQ